MEDSEDNGWIEVYELRSKLSEITNNLKISDKISLVFLICESPSAALDLMNCLLKEVRSNERNNLFFKWLVEEELFKVCNWKENFLEFLVTIQNYKCVRCLGFKKDKVKQMYEVKNIFKKSTVSTIRKVLYNLCENLNSKDTDKLTVTINNTNGIDFDEECIKEGLEYLEYKLLFWNRRGIINLNEREKINLDSLILALTSQGHVRFVYDIEISVEKANSFHLRDEILNRNKNESEFYPISDENNIGYCVIINQRVFTNPVLTTRWGSGKDVERLTEVFSTFGFKVVVHSDLTFDELIEKLEFYSRAIHKNHSVFVLVILSHGSENIIYTSDSQAVDMSTIEMVFQAEICPTLIGKPKIFIVQSCQGEKWQKLCLKNNKDTETYCDLGVPITNSQQVEMVGPQRGDSMIAWSTVQGFASFRDKHNGSWYIQELCNELWRFGDVLDLVEIFTRVNNSLRSIVYDNQFMVPSLLLSLRAKVKFPYLKKNEIAGRQSLLERLIFEKYFLEFLQTHNIGKKYKLKQFL